MEISFHSIKYFCISNSNVFLSKKVGQRDSATEKTGKRKSSYKYMLPKGAIGDATWEWKKKKTETKKIETTWFEAVADKKGEGNEM